QPQPAAIRWPGSTLAAGLLILVRPSGNRIVFDTTEPGWASSTGPSTTSGTLSAASTSPAAARLPLRAATRASATASAGQAVAFMAAARPSATPATATWTAVCATSGVPGCTARGRPRSRARDGDPGAAQAGRSRARPRQIRASTGRSSPPVASGYATTGDAVTSTVHAHGRG